MSNAIFPVLPGVKQGSRLKMPVFKSGIQTTVSDKELRTSYTAYPRWQFALEFEFLRSAQQYQEWQTLLGFFLARQGDFDTWLYDDPDDNTVAGQNFAVADGTSTTYRLVRNMGGFTEPIAAINGTPVIKVDGIVTAVTVNAAEGTVTFAAPPAADAALSWSGQFYYRCRFLQGKQEFKRFLQNFWSASKVELISVK